MIENFSNLEESKQRHELLKIKASLQRSVMVAFCGEEELHNFDTVNAWIDDYSVDFGKIFERRQHEHGFLDKCITENKKVVLEIIDELKASEVSSV